MSADESERAKRARRVRDSDRIDPSEARVATDEFSRFADDEGHPVAKEGLRSLRDERAPDSSLKATLEALSRSGRPEPRPSGIRTFLLWALVGGVLAAALAWYLFFR